MEMKAQKDIRTELMDLNVKFQSMLNSRAGETILHRLIPIEKIKPKNALKRAHWKYLMFTNHNLYTLEKDAYDEGSSNPKKLKMRKYDHLHLSHLIIFPMFEFDYEKFYHMDKETKSESIIINLKN